MQRTDRQRTFPFDLHPTAHARWVKKWDCHMTYLGKLLSSNHLSTSAGFHFLTASLVLLVCFCVFAVVADDITGIIVSDIGWNLNIDTLRYFKQIIFYSTTLYFFKRVSMGSTLRQKSYRTWHFIIYIISYHCTYKVYLNLSSWSLD